MQDDVRIFDARGSAGIIDEPAPGPQDEEEEEDEAGSMTAGYDDYLEGHVPVSEGPRVRSSTILGVPNKKRLNHCR